MAILQVENLEKNFGGSRVLDGISFSMEKGDVVSMIGSSGSGKTTLLRCLNFLERPDSGRILMGEEVLFDAADPANAETPAAPADPAEPAEPAAPVVDTAFTTPLHTFRFTKLQ